MFATLWINGVVAVSMGYAGMGETECRNITAQMMKDVARTYIEAPEVMVDRNGNPVNYDAWTATCEPEMLQGGDTREPNV